MAEWLNNSTPSSDDGASNLARNAFFLFFFCFSELEIMKVMYVFLLVVIFFVLFFLRSSKVFTFNLKKKSHRVRYEDISLLKYCVTH